ncbi:MAG: hypothetical protein ABEJ64_04180 [Candidatus Nanohaloarchaea archaeon]
MAADLTDHKEILTGARDANRREVLQMAGEAAALTGALGHTAGTDESEYQQAAGVIEGAWNWLTPDVGEPNLRSPISFRKKEKTRKPEGGDSEIKQIDELLQEDGDDGDWSLVQDWSRQLNQEYEGSGDQFSYDDVALANLGDHYGLIAFEPNTENKMDAYTLHLTGANGFSSGEVRYLRQAQRDGYLDKVLEPLFKE